MRDCSTQVSDFGIVKDVGDSVGAAETFVGTFTYMSPERIAGGSYSYAADIWSLGLTIMTCVLGKFPYSERSYWGLLNEIKDRPPPQLPATASPEMRDFIEQCLNKDPAKVRALLGTCVSVCAFITAFPSFTPIFLYIAFARLNLHATAPFSGTASTAPICEPLLYCGPELGRRSR